MNEQDLNELLSEQEFIQDNNFSVTVMNSLPQPLNNKRRALVLISSTFLSSLAAFFFTGGSSQNLLDGLFKGLTTYQFSGLVVIALIISIYCAIFITTSEELDY